jgi:guanine deaminase
MSTRRGYRASILTPLAAGGVGFLEDGVMVVEADGVISQVAAWPLPAREPLSLLDLRGRLIAPGFVDTHLHYPQTRVIGSASGPLLEWLDRTVFPEEERFRDDVYARRVALEFVDHCLSVGTTTVSAYSSSDPRATEILFETMAERGLAGFAGLTLMDQNCPEALRLASDVAMLECRRLVARFHGFDRGRLGFTVTPRFALSCSRGLLEAAGALAQELDLPVQTHISEHPREGAETLVAHPFASDYLGVYEATGLLGAKTILAHAIHLSDAEWARVAACGASVAHCPDSNLFLNSGRMRFDRARSLGVPVGLGSDVAAGRTFDMRRATAYAYDNAQLAGFEVSGAELFRASTLGGAEALGIGSRTGSLEPGKLADFVVLAGARQDGGVEAALRAVTFGSELAPLESTFVRGKRVWHARPLS